MLLSIIKALLNLIMLIGWTNLTQYNFNYHMCRATVVVWNSMDTLSTTPVNKTQYTV